MKTIQDNELEAVIIFTSHLDSGLAQKLNEISNGWISISQKDGEPSQAQKIMQSSSLEPHIAHAVLETLNIYSKMPQSINANHSGVTLADAISIWSDFIKLS
jgi:hypothetical protein